MTTLSGCFEVEVRVSGGSAEGVRSFPEEWVVERIDEQGGDGNAAEVEDRTGLLPIINRIFESMQRCSITVVELAEGADGGKAVQRYVVRVKTGFLYELFTKGADKAHPVDGVMPLFEFGRAVVKIYRNGNGHGGADLLVYGRSALTHVFKGNVTAKGKSYKVDVIIIRGDVVDNGLQVIRFAAMVETQRLVTFPAASPEIHRHGIEPSFIENIHHSGYIRPVRAAFQSVEDHYRRTAPDPAEIKVEEVVVGRNNALTDVLNGRHPAEQRREYGVQMPVTQQKRRSVVCSG